MREDALLMQYLTKALAGPFAPVRRPGKKYAESSLPGSGPSIAPVRGIPAILATGFKCKFTKAHNSSRFMTSSHPPAENVGLVDAG
jgi:hypothetical protein